MTLTVIQLAGRITKSPGFLCHDNVSEARFAAERASTLAPALVIIDKREESSSHGSRRATTDVVTERKRGKTVQRKLRAEIEAEVEMAIKDGKDLIITLSTNSTQWQALARQEARIWLDFSITSFDKHPERNLKHVRDAVLKVFQCNPPLQLSSIDSYLRVYLNNRRRIWDSFFVNHGKTEMEPTCTKDAWPKLVKMWKSPLFARQSERMSKSAMIQVCIVEFTEQHGRQFDNFLIYV
jgi:hypothetical protein